MTREAAGVALANLDWGDPLLGDGLTKPLVHDLSQRLSAFGGYPGDYDGSSRGWVPRLEWIETAR